MSYLIEKMKTTVSSIGEFLSPRSMYILESIFNYLSVGQWMKIHGFRTAARFNDRDDAFRLAAGSIGHQKVLYLEFGVWKGDSMRLWSKLLTNPESMLHGFDSFQGLPQEWSAVYPKGSFSMDGNVPVIDDPRVRFFKGWFGCTLPQYQLPEHETMFVNCDADLHSSTKTILDYIGPYIRPGDYLYFDEFHHSNHERRAFEEFLESSGFRVRMVACSNSRSQVLFVRENEDLDQAYSRGAVTACEAAASR